MNNKNGLVIVLIIIILGLAGYIVYDKTQSKVKCKDQPQTTVSSEDKTNNIFKEYYKDENIALSSIRSYTMYYEDYTIEVGDWTNYGQPVTITDENGKEVYSFSPRTNYSLGDITKEGFIFVSLKPYLNSEEGRLYYSNDDCSSTKAYIAYIDLKNKKFEETYYKELTNYNLSPDGIPNCD